ncbi:MAG: ATP-binding protein [Arcobacter sp.]|jgi:nitrogen-specific signal transduction histidine kinase|uniref:sensor histidine kinase n=1 Tax=Arcobacter sp. TaxID=1872629 RepID=UPI002A762A96|nr:ATP-binding protein [Arcobacter sp.]MDY3199986.1 ATP-binding protein [Arcobacter sp.]
MKSKKNIYIIILLFLTLTTFIILGTYYYISSKQENLLNSIYNTTHINIVKTTQNLIKDKQNTTLAIALALAKNDSLYKFMQTQDYEKLDYKKISAEIKEHTKYKDVWIQIVDKNGKSIYRSWTDLKGDNLLFRKDLKNTLTNQNVSTSISVALFNLTLKARTPIFDYNNNFLGALEVITHFNSISKDLKENNIDCLVITDKKYRKILKYPYTNIFIDDYYIANKNANLDLVNYVKNNNVEKYINIPNFIVENGYLISNFILYDKNNEKLAYIINFMDLNNIDLQIVKSFKVQIIMVSVIALIIIFFSFLIYLYSSHLKEIKSQENKKQSILDSQSNIIVITNGEEIIDANKKLYDFFKDASNLEEFKKNYVCICNTFIDMDNEFYIIKKDYAGKNWAEYVLSNEDKNFKVAIKNSNDKITHFSLKASMINNENYIIATFTDITKEVEQIEKDKEKDRLLYQQSKIAAIADTLKNIAHQWRQPLSVISTIASGMKIQKELNSLNNEDFNNSCNIIIDNTQRLSNTIENFTNFFNKDDSIVRFSFVESIKNTINFFDSIFEKNSIKCIFTYDNDMILDCNKNDFSQAILNILDNSVYALIENKQEDERYIFIDFTNKILQIKDTGNGIDEKLLSKILEPYFTTKHQAFGVGLGLYVVQEFFVKNLAYKIDIKNVTFDYENKEYSGTNFIIDFN